MPVDEVLASREVVDPLRLLMLCTPNEGGAAAVLTGGEPAAGQVRIIGQGLRTARRAQAIGEHMPTDSSVEPDDSVTRRAARDAYERAGLAPADIDVAEVQDADSGNEIIAPRSSASVRRGAAVRSSSPERPGSAGELPVNPSGGLLSKGEPVGASGLGQVFEIVEQLRGRCGARQVAGARIGLTHALGAGGNCSVVLFERV